MWRWSRASRLTAGARNPPEASSEAAPRVAREAYRVAVAKGGAIFGAAQAAGNLDGTELGAETIRAAAERIAKGQAEKAEKAQKAEAKLRAKDGPALGLHLFLNHHDHRLQRGRPRCKR